MHITTRNINTMFRLAVEKIHEQEWPVVKESSRQGNVIRVTEPVLITYTNPRERVLFNAARDANPFLHLYHSLWQLSGRNDVAPLAYYASKMSEFSDDGETLNGAYGARWRKAHIRMEPEGTKHSYWQTHDQLDLLVAHLKADPTSRRAVLQMWNVEDDLLKIGKPSNGAIPPHPDWEVYDMTGASKDVCCNTSVMFNLRQEPHRVDNEPLILDITVTNRSNDLVLGMLGTDYVDFSFLQEYVAARLGVEVGLYHHFTNNLHVYDWNWKPEEWLSWEDNADRRLYDYVERSDGVCADQYKPVKFVPLVKNPAVFEQELPRFVEQYNGVNEPTYAAGDWDEPFLAQVAAWMFRAFRTHKDVKDGLADEIVDGHCRDYYVSQIAADDWRLAAKGWIERRTKK